MVTFMGQAPSRLTLDNAGWAVGFTTLKLAKLAGMEYQELVGRAFFVNLIGRYPGKDGRGDWWPDHRAKLAARRVHLRGRVIFLGRQVARAFGAREAYLRPFRLGEATCMIFPHPSGVNRWYNSRANRARASRSLRRWLNEQQD